MKLSVLANLYGSMPLDKALEKITSLGVHTVEIGAGGYPGKDHCNPAELLADEKKLEAFKATFKKYDVEICALACHGNPVHPEKPTIVSTPIFSAKRIAFTISSWNCFAIALSG